MRPKYYPWWLWECYENGFYDTLPPNWLTKNECAQIYADFLSEPNLFARGIKRVMSEWLFSCEHFLTQTNINRVAWIGQSALCIEKNISSEFKYGFKLLTKKEQSIANKIAFKFLERWEMEFKNETKNKYLYKPVDEKRLRVRHSRRSSESFREQISGPFIQIDMFGNT